MSIKNSFNSFSELIIGNNRFRYFSLNTLIHQRIGHVDRLPFSLKILLENLLRHEDGVTVTKDDVRMLAAWDPSKPGDNEIAFMPARVLLQDFTGVPCVVDLSSMRDAVQQAGEDARNINPLQPVDLVIDHSVQVDFFGSPNSFEKNVQHEYGRNRERYTFLKWGQKAFKNFRVVPPGTGIVHQVNLEYLSRVVFVNPETGLSFPDTVIGTDSHTTMINGLGVLGWGVGGIEAEAAMLGQPVSMLVPPVVGFKFRGQLKEGVTATDVVLTVTQMLRKKGVVGKFVEYFGSGLSSLTLPDRATIANMAPEYGATMGFFPVDDETLAYLRQTGRTEATVELVKRYHEEQGLFRTDQTPDPVFSDVLELDLATVEPCVAGPKRPQDRVNLSEAKKSFVDALMADREKSPKPPAAASAMDREKLSDGSVVIAAITSCTNTSNPSVLIEAGLLAKRAADLGLKTKPWVKTSLAPGSKVVMDYLRSSGLTEPLEKMGFYLVGYGCTTCIGNSGPLPPEIEKTVREKDLLVASVLSGNRNFEGRVHSMVRANYLMSPPLVVAYALAGRMDVDLTTEPLGLGKNGKPVYLKDIWPSRAEVQSAISSHVKKEFFEKEYAGVFNGDEEWQKIPLLDGDTYKWDSNSSYIRRASFLETVTATPEKTEPIRGARVLALLGDSVTTDHISPAGSINELSPAGRYLISLGIKKEDFNSYGARRGNHEVMVRGTFANVRLKNKLVPEKEGGVTMKLPDGPVMSIYDAALRYAEEKTSLIVIAGKEYGSGSSRDWAAKGVKLLGVRAVIAESFERIHRSNLIMMGVLPIQFKDRENAESLGLTGKERYDISAVGDTLKPRQRINVKAVGDDRTKEFEAVIRIDTPKEADYFHHGGILPYVVRQILSTR